MRIFKIPFDSKREEKIFGGYLSLRQVVYLMLGTSSLGLFATSLHIATKIVLVCIIFSIALLCAFFKVKEQNFDKYIFYAIKYMFRKKKYEYVRCGK
ncbi:MAG: PrgI family protein [Clostridia bacterium]|nr:PrgI family protein [Clostridia bacterium]